MGTPLNHQATELQTTKQRGKSELSPGHLLKSAVKKEQTTVGLKGNYDY